MNIKKDITYLNEISYVFFYIIYIWLMCYIFICSKYSGFI